MSILATLSDYIVKSLPIVQARKRVQVLVLILVLLNASFSPVTFPSYNSVNINLIAVAVGTTLAVVAVLLRDQLDSNVVGLALVYALQLMGLSSYVVPLLSSAASQRRPQSTFYRTNSSTPEIGTRYRNSSLRLVYLQRSSLFFRARARVII